MEMAACAVERVVVPASRQSEELGEMAVVWKWHVMLVGKK